MDWKIEWKKKWRGEMEIKLLNPPPLTLNPTSTLFSFFALKIEK